MTIFYIFTKIASEIIMRENFMRRLAVQKREDIYASKKDYQTITAKESIRIVPHGDDNVLVFCPKNTPTNDAYYGFGGYFAASSPTSLTVEIQNEDNLKIQKFDICTSWTRVGVITQDNFKDNVMIKIKWKGTASLDCWGINANLINLPSIIVEKNVQLYDLDKTHLLPEVLYLDHDNAFHLDIDEILSTSFNMVVGKEIELKKCSYCQRLLPLCTDRLGTLAFHKHNDKKSNHQNECRSCKKWRINDAFNPLRTTDQLHESSVITRERKLFLREPEILQSIKDRMGAGLKSIIWGKFGKACFYCKKALELKEVQLDHTRPLAYLWPIDEYATCLCADHNNQKKEKFPIDFYSEKQLRELSEITSLPYAQLIVKDINEVELQRIINEIESFAKNWDSRTFAATARKIMEYRTEIDLFEILKAKNEVLYNQIRSSADERPNPTVPNDNDLTLVSKK